MILSSIDETSLNHIPSSLSISYKIFAYALVLTVACDIFPLLGSIFERSLIPSATLFESV
jgi:hypothetical protein